MSDPEIESRSLTYGDLEGDWRPAIFLFEEDNPLRKAVMHLLTLEMTVPIKSVSIRQGGMTMEYRLRHPRPVRCEERDSNGVQCENMDCDGNHAAPKALERFERGIR